MDNKDIIEFNKKRMVEISEELTVISSALELEVERYLAPIKAQALSNGAEHTKELLKLQTQVALLKVQLETNKKLDNTREELESLSFQLLTDEEKKAAYQDIKEECDRQMDSLMVKYGLK